MGFLFPAIDTSAHTFVDRLQRLVSRAKILFAKRVQWLPACVYYTMGILTVGINIQNPGQYKPFFLVFLQGIHCLTSVCYMDGAIFFYGAG